MIHIHPSANSGMIVARLYTLDQTTVCAVTRWHSDGGIVRRRYYPGPASIARLLRKGVADYRNYRIVPPDDGPQ